MIRKLAKQCPIIYSDIKLISQNHKHGFEGWVKVEYNTWDMKKMDFIKEERVVFFDGENFRQTNLALYDGADWISAVLSKHGEL